MPHEELCWAVERSRSCFFLSLKLNWIRFGSVEFHSDFSGTLLTPTSLQLGKFFFTMYTAGSILLSPHRLASERYYTRFHQQMNRERDEIDVSANG